MVAVGDPGCGTRTSNAGPGSEVVVNGGHGGESGSIRGSSSNRW